MPLCYGGTTLNATCTNCYSTYSTGGSGGASSSAITSIPGLTQTEYTNANNSTVINNAKSRDILLKVGRLSVPQVQFRETQVMLLFLLTAQAILRHTPYGNSTPLPAPLPALPLPTAPTLLSPLPASVTPLVLLTPPTALLFPTSGKTPQVPLSQALPLLLTN